MKLTKDQITTLKKLISYKGYPEIDVQYEILDHVACKVEELLDKDPRLALDNAFRKVHSEFGIFGFSTLEESYKKSIEKRYYRYFLEELKTLFTSYRIIYPLVSALILYWLSATTRPFGFDLSLPIWLGFFFISSLIILFIIHSKSNKELKNYASYKSAFNSFAFLNFLMQINFFGMRFLENPDYSFVWTSKSIITWISLVTISACFILIFLIPSVLQRSIEATRKLQAIYEG
jgi:hypothetical protein